jgi:phosphatidylethanolamine/phosphatidyl-N-methylethanolamine N-methyltransferase
MEVIRQRYFSVLDALNFFRLWFLRPQTIGAVVPSSERLALAVANEVDFARPGVIVELGGGTGSITQALLEKAANSDQIVVIEREASLCMRLSARFPGIRVIRGDAENLKKLMENAGIDQVNAIVSGLPLLSLSSRSCHKIIHQAFDVMPDDGVFVQFTYGLASPMRRPTIKKTGIVGCRSGWVIRNLPPAALWRYKREISPSSPGAKLSGLGAQMLDERSGGY